ncbi:transmembrane protein 150C [Sebastes umbrosus]|uniref:transmembrane protein 150C n=1 Tax=Sebastes umbrosus TaxID=72105 RepID=UPI0018A05A37|nr:transmembrane protein 150C [Sebastes umbrosus]XP_037608289.1 transmembrane protein 150C [Sebastes umbrosus]XP_037608290.1 transmembrane protein 150C [Sebastes umbrosus]XP_037608291.1 transmembrane protein 150C [Sebastes umbrosus]
MLSFSLWAFLPPVYAVLTAAGLWTVYFVAVNDGRIAPLGSKYRRRNGSFYPPYISIAGNFPPASCIFSEIMNLAAFVGFIIAVLRYVQLRHKMDKQWLNVGSLVAFSIACFGMTLVGNVQLYSGEMIHNFGTFLTFGLGTLFCWVQSYITVRVNLKNEGRKAGILRFLLSGCITVCMIPHIALMAQGFHMQAAQLQWAVAMFFLAFFGTFAIEFRHNRFSIVCTDNSGGPGSYAETLSEVSRHQPDQL